ncbi:MAG: hypothetical protein M0002_01970 [Rhodospirillales bacterium]|nr:hypothetical protein [Rhodospirillales bacterium]
MRQAAPMRTLAVLQHTDSEYLGLMEDHFEQRGIRFRYVRPFVPGTVVPATAEEFDGLVLLGAGPRGVVSGDLLPSLGPELRLTADFLRRELPVIGIGAGAAMLAVAAGGGAEAAPLRFCLATAERAAAESGAAWLPERFPAASYLRDRPLPPADAAILARNEGGAPLLFQIGPRALGFLFHPGMKTAMLEDLVMEFPEAPDDIPAGLDALRAAQHAIAEALSTMMVGLVVLTGLMAPP